MDVFSRRLEEGWDWVSFRGGRWAPDEGLGRAPPFRKADQAARQGGFEELHYFLDPRAGLRLIAAVHNTVRGPALGGLRLWHYTSAWDATRDALRLARGMTFKNAAIGLDLGGGKAVGWLGDGQLKSASLLRGAAHFLPRLEGRYVTAEDVGTTVADMDLLLEETRRLSDRVLVVCTSEANGGSGNPSPFTAYGIHEAIRISCKRAFGIRELRGRSVAIQGLGNAGRSLAGLLAEDGANLVVTDLDRERLEAVGDLAAGKVLCEAVPQDEIYEADVDVFSPCALGAVLDDETIPRLRARVVAGSANNQFADEQRHARMLRNRGILYAPDFVTNAGGVANAASEYYARVHGLLYRKAAVMAQIERIFQNLNAIFDRAAELGMTTQEAAMEIARERIRAPGKRSGHGTA